MPGDKTGLCIWHLSLTDAGRKVWPQAAPLVIACARDELDAREFAMQCCAPVIDMAATQINFLKLANFWRDPKLTECRIERSGEWPPDKQGVLFPTSGPAPAQGPA